MICLLACKKNDLQETTLKNVRDYRTEKKIIGEYAITAFYSKNKLFKSIAYDTLIHKKAYDNFYNDAGIMTNSINYFENGKIKATLDIDTLPNYYLYKEFYQNGTYKAVGGISMIKNKAVKTGVWITLNPDESIYSVLEFGSDNNGKERLIKEQIQPKNQYLRMSEDGKFVVENE